MKNYYQILGIESDASEAEIKKAYKKLAKKFHPDVNEGDTYFENLFKDIQEANECLSIDSSKTEYDKRYKDFFLTPKKKKQEAPIVNQPTPVPEEQNSLTGAILLITIIFVALIAAVVIQNENRNSIDSATSTDLAVVIDSTSIDSTSIDSAVIDSSVIENVAIQYVVAEPEPETLQIVDNLSTEDKAVISFLQEYYDFYDRDHVFRNPMVKKLDDYNYDVSVEVCTRSNKDNDFFYRAEIIKISIDENGDLKMGSTYRF